MRALRWLVLLATGCGLDVPEDLPYLSAEECSIPADSFTVEYAPRDGDCGFVPPLPIGSDCEMHVHHELEACVAGIQVYCWVGDVLLETRASVTLDGGEVVGDAEVRLIDERGATLCTGTYATRWRS